MVKRRAGFYLTGLFFYGVSRDLLLVAVPWVMLDESNGGYYVALTACTNNHCVIVALIKLGRLKLDLGTCFRTARVLGC